ncbi:MAG: hypothetical protein IJ856_07000 [Candidatus Methanomethylophilaceae archaeon]|nr:hypothetical protein [Candidatus Methanomethylophilaceae archaeon]
MNMNLVVVAGIAVVIIGLVAAFAIAGNGGDKSDSTTDEQSPSFGSAAVVYFSESGNTEGIARKIADVTGGELIRIVPTVEYTSADLDYGNSGCRSKVEDLDSSARPGISNDMDLGKYNVVFLGYPIWYGDSPKIMWTFVETHDLSGKTIVPFCTSGSSGVGSSDDHLKALTDKGTWLDGKRFPASASQKDVESWVNGLGVAA